MRLVFACMATVAALAGSLTAASVSAQSNFTYRPTVGAWRIGPINSAGKFSRCVADLSSPAGLLRFAYFRDHSYFVSWPSATGQVVPASSATLKFDRGYSVQRTSNSSNRPSVPLDSTMIDNLFRANETIAITQSGVTRAWPLNRQDMTDVFVEMENCTHKYER